MTTPPRLALVVTDTYSTEDPDQDTPILVPALRARGVDAVAAVWHDPAVNWSAFDLVVIRSPWDYPERLEDFLSWLTSVEAVTHVSNAPSVVRWNLDKRYLAELDAAGIPVVPTEYCTSIAEARAALHAHGHERIVVKPAMSNGSRDTGLFDAADPAAASLAERILAGGGVVMIQPEIAELSEGAEKGLYAMGGHFSHAIAKGALLAHGGGLIGGVYEEHPEVAPVTEAERAFADEVLAAVARVTGAEMPLYARVDTVDSAAHGLVVLEVEVIEPALNLHVAPEAIDAVADAIAQAAREAAAGRAPSVG